jgi:hypothetical protein
MASAIGHARANGDVWEVCGIVEKLRARGESEGWTESAGRRHVLARPGHVCARLGAFWASRAWSGLVSAHVSSTQGLYQQVCGSEGELVDMVRGIREEWR